MMQRIYAALALLLWITTVAVATCGTGALPFQLQNNTLADATQVMANFNQISSGVAASCAGSGVNNDITALSGLTTPVTPAQGGTSNFTGTTSAGSANAQTTTASPSGWLLTTGYRVRFTAGFTNTGATTLNVSGTGAVNVFRQTPSGAQALTGGEINSGERTEVEYDGTQYQLVTRQAEFGGYGPSTTLTAAATTDLGTIPSHNVTITGNTTITSFGSTASTTYPFYKLFFSGTPLLTQNATSLVLPGGVNIQTAANDTAILLYGGSGNWFVVGYQRATGLAVTPTLVPGLLFGCTLSNGGGSQIITINACTTTSDDQTTSMVVGSTYTKTFANFVVGSGNGGLDTGSIANNTWYHVFEIERPDTGVVDYLISLSATAPTFPANYTKKRRLGSIKTDGTPNIIAFFQNNDTFLWSAMPALDFSTTSSTTATTVAVQTPPGVRTEAMLNLSYTDNGGVTGNQSAMISSLDIADTAPSQQVDTSPLASIALNFSVAGARVGAQVRVWTNTSSQIRHRESATGLTIRSETIGWVDPRGRTQ